MAEAPRAISRRRVLRGALAGAGVLVAGSLHAACGGTSGPATSTPARPQGAADTGTTAAPAPRPTSAGSGPLRKFAFGGPGGTKPGQPSCTDFTMFLPLEKGWYAELGIDFEKINLPASAYYAALEANQLDAVQDDTNLAGVRAQGIGEDLVIVWNHTDSGTFHGVARPGLNIRDPNAWVGAKVRVDRPGGIVHVYQSKFIKNLGGDPLRAQYIAVAAPGGFLDVTNSLLAGTFDVNQLSGIGFPYALRNGCQEIGYLPDVMPTPMSGMVASRSRLADDPAYRALVKDVLRAWVRANAYYTNPANREDLIDLGIQWAGNPPELQRSDYERAIEDEVKAATRLGKLRDPQAYRNMWAAALETGVVTQKEVAMSYTQYDFRQIIDYSVVDQAIREEGLAV